MAIVDKLPENVNIFEKWITEEPVYDVTELPKQVIILTRNILHPDGTDSPLIVREYNDPTQNIPTNTIASPVQKLPGAVDVGDTLIIRTPVTYIRFYEDLLDPFNWGTLIAEINRVQLDPTVQIKIDNDTGTLA